VDLHCPIPLSHTLQFPFDSDRVNLPPKIRPFVGLPPDPPALSALTTFYFSPPTSQSSFDDAPAVRPQLSRTRGSPSSCPFSPFCFPLNAASPNHLEAETSGNDHFMCPPLFPPVRVYQMLLFLQDGRNCSNPFFGLPPTFTWLAGGPVAKVFSEPMPLTANTLPSPL